MADILRRHPWLGHLPVRDAVHLLRDQITEKDERTMQGRGLQDWFTEMDICISDFANYDDEDLDLFWQGCREDMEMFHSAVDFCRSELEDIIAGNSEGGY